MSNNGFFYFCKLCTWACIYILIFFIFMICKYISTYLIWVSCLAVCLLFFLYSGKWLLTLQTHLFLYWGIGISSVHVGKTLFDFSVYVQLIQTSSFFIYILNNNTAVVNFSPVNSFSGVVIADGVLQNNVHFERHGMHYLPPEMYFCFSVHNFLGSKLIL